MTPRSNRITAVLLALALPVTGIATPTVVRAQASRPPTRTQVLDALRAEVARLHQIPVVFRVTRYFLDGDWAWVTVQPRSRDGLARYEPVSVLLTRQRGTWRVVEIVCTQDDEPACLGSPDFAAALRARVPGLPPCLLQQLP